MPSRILRESLLTSPSIAACTPGAQDRFHRYLLVADDYGCFESDPEVLKGRLWAKRSDMTSHKVLDDLNEYEQAGMLERWEEGGRMFAFLRSWGRHQRIRADGSSYKRKFPIPPSVKPFADLHGYYAANADRSPLLAATSRYSPLVAASDAVAVSGAVSGAVADNTIMHPTSGEGALTLVDSTEDRSPEPPLKARKANPANDLLDRFDNLLLERAGRIPAYSRPQARSLVGRALSMGKGRDDASTWQNAIQASLDAFTRDRGKDGWLAREGWPLTYWFKHLNTYLTQKSTAVSRAAATNDDLPWEKEYINAGKNT